MGSREENGKIGHEREDGLGPNRVDIGTGWLRMPIGHFAPGTPIPQKTPYWTLELCKLVKWRSLPNAVVFGAALLIYCVGDGVA